MKPGGKGKQKSSPQVWGPRQRRLPGRAAGDWGSRRARAGAEADGSSAAEDVLGGPACPEAAPAAGNILPLNTPALPPRGARPARGRRPLRLEGAAAQGRRAGRGQGRRARPPGRKPRSRLPHPSTPPGPRRREGAAAAAATVNEDQRAPGSAVQATAAPAKSEGNPGVPRLFGPEERSGAGGGRQRSRSGAKTEQSGARTHSWASGETQRARGSDAGASSGHGPCPLPTPPPGLTSLRRRRRRRNSRICSRGPCANHGRRRDVTTPRLRPRAAAAPGGAGLAVVVEPPSLGATPQGSLTIPLPLPSSPTHPRATALRHPGQGACARAPLCGGYYPLSPKLWRWGALKVWGGLRLREADSGFSLPESPSTLPVAALNPDRGVIAVFPSLNSHPWGSLGTAAAVTSAGRAAPNSPLRHCRHPGGSGSSALLAGAGPGPSQVEGAESRAQ